MKRSKMIEELATILEKSFDGNNGSWDLTAHTVLSELEKLGMAPPFSDKVFQKNARKYIEPSGNEWDDENEPN